MSLGCLATMVYTFSCSAAHGDACSSEIMNLLRICQFPEYNYVNSITANYIFAIGLISLAVNRIHAQLLTFSVELVLEYRQV